MGVTQDQIVLIGALNSLLLVGHLVGDYLLQNDPMATNKTKSTLHCGLHVVLYTGACIVATLAYLPWWAYAIMAITHFCIDRWRLANIYMKWAKQEKFRDGMFSPWSGIVTDNSLHIVINCSTVVLAVLTMT